MSDRPEWEQIPFDEALEMLTDCDLLTERQAEAWLHRDVEHDPRDLVAEHMDISPNTLDDRLSEARNKIESAEETLDVIDEIRNRPIPERCAECDVSLPGYWSTNDEGEAICFDCAGIDESEAFPEDSV